MLKAWIITLRRQPKTVRNQVALVIAGGCTAMIFAAWVITLPMRLSGTPSNTANTLDAFTNSVSSELERFRQVVPSSSSATQDETTLLWSEYAPATTSDTTATDTVPVMIEQTEPTPSADVPTERTVRIATTTPAVDTQVAP